MFENNTPQNEENDYGYGFRYDGARDKDGGYSFTITYTFGLTHIAVFCCLVFILFILFRYCF